MDFLKYSLFLHMIWNAVSGLDYCYNEDTSPYRYYSTKTTYDEALNKTVPTHQDTHTIDGCEPKVFYLLCRHGFRYPGDDDIVLLTEQLPGIKEKILQNGSLCMEDKQALQNWTLNMVEADGSNLAESGWRELRKIAERYKSSYPSLLDVPYDENKMQFWHSEKARTRDSARAFVEGLYGSYENVTIVEIQESVDKILRYYENCPKYEEAKDSVTEEGDFQNGPEMMAVLDDVRARLGVEDLSIDHMIDVLYEVCMFEYGLFGVSPWCTAFTESDLKVIEYLNDLEYYWEDAYGNGINYEQTCGLLRDIQDHLNMRDPVTKQSSTFNVLTRFGHSATMNQLFARLGINKDDHAITASNYASSANRKWKTSFSTPMASNIAFVRYECTNESDDKVAVFLNEEPIVLPIDGCNNDGICTMDALNTAWEPYTSSCNLEEICTINPDGSTTPVSYSTKIDISFALINIGIFLTLII